MVSAEKSRKQVMVVDDESGIRESLRMMLSRFYDVTIAEDGDRALQLLTEADSASMPDLMLLDVMMPGTDGLTVLQKLKQDHSNIPVIMLTASSTVQTAVQAMKTGAVDYLNKPFDVDELLSLIEETIAKGPSGRSMPSSVLSSQHQRSNLPAAVGDFGSIIGKHPLMEDLYEKITQLAVRDTTIMITGESGTGKELVAREIHDRSTRSKEAFIAVNCAAIPETLIESELFGHEKGAFTHAVEGRVGLCELANGGTLFLDEIGELSLPVQVKMLRFLQEQEFYRVGSSKSTRVNVRIIVATNKNLEKAIESGEFRQDLYYRINVVTLNVAPLRERKSDIEPLIESFLDRFKVLYGDRVVSFNSDAMELLRRYSWPGNVRELENVTESILALCKVDVVTPEDLPSRFRQGPSTASLKEQVDQGNLSFEDAEKAFETDIILKALQKTNYVQTKAADMLGISRRILKYKMDKLGISEREE
jgi:two-component system response regulator AtoC